MLVAAAKPSTGSLSTVWNSGTDSAGTPVWRVACGAGPGRRLWISSAGFHRCGLVGEAPDRLLGVVERHPERGDLAVGDRELALVAADHAALGVEEEYAALAHFEPGSSVTTSVSPSSVPPGWVTMRFAGLSPFSALLTWVLVSVTMAWPCVFEAPARCDWAPVTRTSTIESARATSSSRS